MGNRTNVTAETSEVKTTKDDKMSNKTGSTTQENHIEMTTLVPKKHERNKVEENSKKAEEDKNDKARNNTGTAETGKIKTTKLDRMSNKTGSTTQENHTEMPPMVPKKDGRNKEEENGTKTEEDKIDKANKSSGNTETGKM